MTENSASEIVIEAGAADRHYWRDLWRFRELFAVLAMRDVAVRYKQTAIGLGWALVQPLVSMVVFTLIFGRLAKLESPGNVPYALMVFAGLLPWQLMSSAFTGAGNSLLGNAGLISKVYFPRLIVPASAVVVCVIDFAVALVVFGALMVFYRQAPGLQILALPLFVALAMFAALGPGLLIGALNVRYRDFRHLIPFVVQIGMYASPVAYSSTVVPEVWRTLYYLNPAASIIDGFRWCLLPASAALWWPGVLLGCCTSALLMALGVRQFRRTEKTFADMI